MSTFSGDLIHYAMNACLVKLVSLHGTWITTIEGLGSVKVNETPLYVYYVYEILV